MTNVLILIPLWKRPEVWEISARNLKRFREEIDWMVTVLAVICPDDPNIVELEATCKRYGIEKCYYPNLPLGKKLNAGLHYALSRYSFNYLMNFGSDDLIHPAITALYATCLRDNLPVFGVDSLYFYELLTGKTFFFQCYTDGLAVGAGRMIRRDILEGLIEKDVFLYDNDQNRSLDSNSHNNIEIWMKTTDFIVKTDKFPYIVDIKTLTNINHISQLEPHKTQITYCNSSILTDNFEIL